MEFFRKFFGAKKVKCSITLSEVNVNYFKRIADEKGTNFSALIDSILSKEFAATEDGIKFIEAQTFFMLKFHSKQEELMAQISERMDNIKDQYTFEEFENLMGMDGIFTEKEKQERKEKIIKDAMHKVKKEGENVDGK